MKEIYWITAAKPHRIAIVARPLGDNWLADYLQRLSREGIHVLVSMLTAEESAELGLSDEERLCDHCGMRYFSFPIADRSVPDEGKVPEFLDLIVNHVERGRGVGFHCRGGIGRSSLMAALVLARLGWTPDAAFRAIEKSRGCRVPDTFEQEQWVREFVARFPR